MNIDCSKYFVGTSNLVSTNKKIAYKNGEKIEENDKTAGTVAVYDFSQCDEKISINSREEFSEIMQDINQQHGDGVMVSISGLGLNFLNITKGTLVANNSARVIEGTPLTNEMRTEIFERVREQERLFGDDDKNILNHSFINGGFGYDEDVKKYASGYAKYLNNELETEYDDEIFYNLHDEELYHKEVSGKMYQYASNVLSYFMMGSETEADKIKLSDQLADAVIFYAKNLANGEVNPENVDTKLNIGEFEVSYEELKNIQSTLQKINECGVRAVHSDVEESLDYLGLGSNYDTVAYAQLGLRTSQVNYFSNGLSEDASNLVKKTWNARLTNTIAEKYIKPMKQTSEILKEHYNSIGNYYKAGSLNVSYEGSKFQKVYNMFANISGDDSETFLSSFNVAMEMYNEYRMSGAFHNDGYVGTIAENEQLAFLESSKSLLFEEE